MAKAIAPLKLKITGSDEDVPEKLFASGKCGEGSVAVYVQRRDGPGMLAHQVKGKTELWSTETGQAPPRPSAVVDEAAAIARLKVVRDTKLPHGASSLKGSWTGTFACENEKPVVRLQRKVASYGVLGVESGPKGWTVTFTREKRWYGDAKVESQEGISSLAGAILAGMRIMLQLSGEACSVRDTHRRDAKDADYAAANPRKAKAAPKETPSALEKAPKASKSAATAPTLSYPELVAKAETKLATLRAELQKENPKAAGLLLYQAKEAVAKLGTVQDAGRTKVVAELARLEKLVEKAKQAAAATRAAAPKAEAKPKTQKVKEPQAPKAKAPAAGKPAAPPAPAATKPPASSKSADKPSGKGKGFGALFDQAFNDLEAEAR